jgi:methylenetetrahydrofolate dehydrogenase (NADP+)/methenyltetrahydrofolate cyclohydrolase
MHVSVLLMLFCVIFFPGFWCVPLIRTHARAYHSQTCPSAFPVIFDSVRPLHRIADLNANPDVHGILVQLPLPPHLVADNIIAAIHPSKDVDGLHGANVGSLMQRGPEHTPLISCTPLGCIELIKRAGYDIAGKHAVVLGRSNIVGKPVAQLLLAHNATVTVCHSRTVDIPAFTRQADILICAIGKAEFVKGDWIKPGAVVIDVGINAVNDDSPKGYHLVGDVAFAEAQIVAGAITPVPGGVGPMTIAMLMHNTVTAFGLAVQQPKP